MLSLVVFFSPCSSKHCKTHHTDYKWQIKLFLEQSSGTEPISIAICVQIKFDRGILCAKTGKASFVMLNRKPQHSDKKLAFRRISVLQIKIEETENR